MFLGLLRNPCVDLLLDLTAFTPLAGFRLLLDPDNLEGLLTAAGKVWRFATDDQYRQGVFDELKNAPEFAAFTDAIGQGIDLFGSVIGTFVSAGSGAAAGVLGDGLIGLIPDRLKALGAEYQVDVDGWIRTAVGLVPDVHLPDLGPETRKVLDEVVGYVTAALKDKVAAFKAFVLDGGWWDALLETLESQLWPWPGIVDELSALPKIFTGLFDGLWGDTSGGSSGGLLGTVERLARGVQKAAEALSEVWGILNGAIAQLGLWVWIITVAVGSIFPGIGNAAGGALASAIGSVLAVSSIAQQGADLVLRVVRLVEYFSKVFGGETQDTHEDEQAEDQADVTTGDRVDAADAGGADADMTVADTADQTVDAGTGGVAASDDSGADAGDDSGADTAESDTGADGSDTDVGDASGSDAMDSGSADDAGADDTSDSGSCLGSVRGLVTDRLAGARDRAAGQIAGYLLPGAMVPGVGSATAGTGADGDTLPDNGPNPQELIAGLLDNAINLAITGIGALLGGIAVSFARRVTKVFKVSPRKLPPKKGHGKGTGKGRGKGTGKDRGKGKGHDKKNRRNRDRDWSIDLPGDCPIDVSAVGRAVTGGQCFGAGTPVARGDGSRIAIEDVGLGDRVQTWFSGEPGYAAAMALPDTEIDPARTWAVWFAREEGDGLRREMGLLRSLDWMADEGIAAVGDRVALDLPEMDVSGDFQVIAIEPCPEIENGPGRIVTAVFRHNWGRVYNLRVEGEPAPVRPTRNHPFWSVDRIDWIPVSGLLAGERLAVGDGVVTVLGFDEGVQEAVFNFEVDVDHCYRVGEQAILVHNATKGKKKKKKPNPIATKANAKTTKLAKTTPKGPVKKAKTTKKKKKKRRIKPTSQDPNPCIKTKKNQKIPQKFVPVPKGKNFGCEYLSDPQQKVERAKGALEVSIGGVTKTPPRQAHHLIGVAEAKNSVAIRRATMLGYNIDGAHNGVAYASYRKKKDVKAGIALSLSTGEPLHRGRHAADRYTLCVKRHLDKLDAAWPMLVSDCELCAYIKRIEAEIKRALESYELKLHRSDPHKYPKGTPECHPENVS